MNMEYKYETDRLKLRKVVADDIHLIYAGLGNKKVTQHYDVHFNSIEETKGQMNWYNNLEISTTGLWWVIFDKATNTFVGAGGYCEMDNFHKRAEIGFWLLPEYWGRGYMQEAMTKLFEVGFEHLNLNRIEAFVISDNAKCKRAIEKVGLHHEGTFREYEIKDGKLIDVDIYSILKRNNN